MLLAFVDLETTGLNPREGNIIELGIVVTNEKLEVLGFYSQNVRPLYGDWKFEDGVVRKMHTNNGLIAEIEAGDCLRRYEAELDALAWLESFGPEQLRLVGNSIWFDKAWLLEHMPDLHNRFHRQVIDITSLNKFAEIFAPGAYASRPVGGGAHRALADAINSMKTLQHYGDVLGDISYREFSR
jgi:oligoribonuclease